MSARTQKAGLLFLGVVALLGFTAVGWAAPADIIPPAPRQYFNDYAGIVSSQTVSRLNEQLAQFDRATSNQVVVAVFPKMPAGTTLEEFAVRAFERWRIGKRGKDNGVALFVFMAERQMRIEVGYGLEGVLPDALANRIIAEQITPAFRQGHYEAGLTAGVQSILQAIQGEYRQDRATSPRTKGDRGISPKVFLLLFFLFFLLPLFRRRGTVYHHRRYPYYGGWGGGWTGGSSWGGGGGFSGGGFSGGGGRSGGGGASGSW